jgi:hypothetical protein
MRAIRRSTACSIRARITSGSLRAGEVAISDLHCEARGQQLAEMASCNRAP